MLGLLLKIGRLVGWLVGWLKSCILRYRTHASSASLYSNWTSSDIEKNILQTIALLYLLLPSLLFRAHNNNKTNKAMATKAIVKIIIEAPSDSNKISVLCTWSGFSCELAVALNGRISVGVPVVLSLVSVVSITFYILLYYFLLNWNLTSVIT